MASLTADRRLWVTADYARVVEEGDEAAAFLLAGAGRLIHSDDVARYKLSHTDGRVILPPPPKPEPEPAEEPTEKEADPSEDKEAAEPENKALAPARRKRRKA